VTVHLGLAAPPFGVGCAVPSKVPATNRTRSAATSVFVISKRALVSWLLRATVADSLASFLMPIAQGKLHFAA
jgi:hypothetical protein